MRLWGKVSRHGVPRSLPRLGERGLSKSDEIAGSDVWQSLRDMEPPPVFFLSHYEEAFSVADPPTL